jgi:hypothetical protein
VTASRHRHYRRALVLIFALEEDVGMKDSHVLREIAQDLLLTRGREPQEAERRLDHLARVLTRLIEESALSLGASTELWRELRRCGPGPGERGAAIDESQAARPQEVAR